MKYEAIHKLTSSHSVRKMCIVLNVRERGYYQWLKQEVRRNQRRKSELDLVKAVENTFRDNKEIYGSRKIHRALLKDGIEVSEWKVRRIMRQNGFYSIVNKKYKAYSNKKLNGRYAADIIKQNFKVEIPNKIWVSDITYIKTTLGWYYLACVMDLYNREVIGYSTSKNIDTELVKRALGNAIAKYPNVEGTIFHSDRGSQYASAGCKNILSDHKMIQSMSRPGCPYDNSCIESFFACLKKECIYRRQYFNPSQVDVDIFSYIELFYNRKRMHSYLNYLSPISYRIQK
ncbi:MAG: IS3 family transposase [Tenericutes bacterium]|nr:IS3 family transposase [Mycoplasmatota bacterium]